MSDISNDPLQALGGMRRAYVIPELKLLYISTAKNACTSIKWMMAGLAGEDPERFRPGLGRYPTRAAGIHNRKLWQHVPRLNEIPTQMRASISTANGWHIFGVTRDPRARLFFAWQNKFLLRSSSYSELLGYDWAPRPVHDQEQIIEDFARFVRAVGTNHDHEAVVDDSHFAVQSHRLMEHAVPYTRLYDITELKQMVADVTTHVRRLGFGGEVILRRDNDTPLRAIAPVFADGVRELVEDLYADDFERFGHRWNFADIESRGDSWSADAISHARSLMEANYRIGDLSAIGKDLRKKNKQLRARLDQVQRHIDEPVPAATRHRGVLRRLRG